MLIVTITGLRVVLPSGMQRKKKKNGNAYMLPFSTSKLSFYNEISRKAEGTVQKNLSNMLKEIHIFTKDSSMLIFQVNNGRLFLFIFYFYFYLWTIHY